MPTRQEAEAAVRVLLRWAGDDPGRPGLKDTPARVIRAYEEFFAGYRADVQDILQRTFDDVDGYDEVVIVRGISFHSYCEHHLVPIIGTAHVGYLPGDRVVGLSKIARIVDAFARRLQVQERMTREIADTINLVLSCRGVAVVLEAEHQCMSSRGVRKHGSTTVTSCLLGVFKDKPEARAEFLSLIRS